MDYLMLGNVKWPRGVAHRDFGQMAHRRLVSRTTSLVVSPRENSMCFRSRDQSNLKIFPDVNLVNCIGFPPAMGCCQMFGLKPFW
jgi:hypothetical protein